MAGDTGTPQTKFKIIFEGTFAPGVPHDEIRQKLLKIYRGNAASADRFFTGRRLIIRKDIDYETALGYRTSMEKMGLRCIIVEATNPVAPSVPPRPSIEEKQPQETPENKPTALSANLQKTTGREPLRGNRTQNFLAVAMIMLLSASIGLRLWAVNGTRGIRPPDNVETNGELACVHFNKILFILTYDGRLVRRLDLAKLGINREPADLALLGNGDILIGDLDKGEILRCSGPEPSCRRIGPAGGYRINEYFKLLADEKRNLLFITDTNNNKLLVQALDGSALSEVDTASNISFPNDMALDPDNRLWLSDTGNSRLLAFDDIDGSFAYAGKVIGTGFLDKNLATKKKTPTNDVTEALREMQERNRHIKDDLIRTRPLAISWDGAGKLWVAASDGLISTSVIKVFDQEGVQMRSIPLGDKSIPLDLACLGDRMLAADDGLFEIFSIGAESDRAVPFGDETFRSELTGVRDKLRRYESVKRWAGLGIWLLGVGAFILVVVVVAGKYTRGRAPMGAAGRAAPARQTPRAAAAAGMAVMQTAPLKKYRLEFTGDTREYFRIWIVNVFLTIVTLGIYAAWAKVRTRKYFYRNTLLDGHPFDYTADPKSILKGYLIVGGGAAIYYSTRTVSPLYGLAVFGLFGLVIPLLIFKSLRFFTYHSVYRNIRHRFRGTLGESYKTYLLIPALIPFTLGLIVPYWEFLKKRYFFRNVAYGAAENSFSGSYQPFYPAYIKFSFAAAGIIIAGTIAGGAFMSGTNILAMQDKGAMSGTAIGMMVWIYGLTLLAVTFSQQYIYAWATNYCLSESTLGRVRFESTLQGGRLFWIRLSNIAVIVASLGLLTPWAKVRRMRYFADNITVIADDDLNDFAAAVEPGESSYGDVAADFFDFEIGL